MAIRLFRRLTRVCPNTSCIQRRKRIPLAVLSLLFATTVICLSLLLIQFSSTEYKFPMCNLTSLSSAVIGYQSISETYLVDNKHITNNLSFCQPKSPLADRLPVPKWRSNLLDWSARNTVECVRYCFATSRLKTRTLVVLSCNGSHSRILIKSTNSADKIFSVNFNDTCLSDVIDSCSLGGKPVPNIIHYVWYGRNKFRFEHFLSFISVIRCMKPFLILIHGEDIPFGTYWTYLLQIFPNIIHVRRPLMRTIYGNALSYKEHGADIMRIEALYRYGGLYLDFDSVLLRDVDELKRYDVTMGRENSNNLGNQFIMAVKGAKFLQLWHEGYKYYKERNWGWNSLYVPYEIATRNPDLIHIEGNRFTRPNFQERNTIYNKNFDWSFNYAMHLYMRDYGRHLDLDIIRRLNTTIGAVSRHILFGNKELCRD